MLLGRLRQRHPGTPLWRLLFYELIKAVSAALLIVCWRLRWTGSSRVPPTGPLLIVANHQSYLDPPIVAIMMTCRHIDFVARGGLFNNPHFGGLISTLHSIPIREDGGSEMGAIKEALRRLGQGKAVLIFPEGVRSRDGSLHEFKRGVAVLLKRANCPVLPIGLAGPFEVWPRDRKLPRVFRGTLAGAIGTPIEHADLMEGGTDAALRRLENEVRALRTRAGLLNGRRFLAPTGRRV